MPTARRLVLAASDPRFAQAVQVHLQRTLHLAVPVVRFEDMPALLTPDADGDVLLAAADPGDARGVETVVREAKVQLSPARFAVVESEQVRGQAAVEGLNPYLSGIWVWPQQARELTGWARRALTPDGVAFADPGAETVAQTIRRKLVCHTPSLAPMADQLSIAAAHDVTVLIEGESGTGKTFLARLLHDCSPRRANRFLSISCGALPGNQVASEFFGHVPGAFTGADAARVGRFTAAGEGTILLDEIDTLEPEHQANLLRVIETGEFEPVGGTETHTCRARIIASTNQSLNHAVERGCFRHELYYRLHVLSFHLPPLRHRPEDIGPLARGMAARYGTKFGKRLYRVCPEALRALEAFPWPGNIRQLENVIQQAALTSSGEELKLHHLSPLVTTSQADVPTSGMPGLGGYGGTLKESRAAMERTNILRALERAGQSRTRAAQLLGISRVTLYKKMDRYGLLTKKEKPVPHQHNGTG